MFSIYSNLLQQRNCEWLKNIYELRDSAATVCNVSSIQATSNQ